ncbi:hypothetical protein HMPREF1022_01555 [Desulfovibrio sp. 6_1_46AFAA]|nr:hypothetical protein HMPREF1022_01555 [Desulfovibrio sp. 6_1_46AFAA]
MNGDDRAWVSEARGQLEEIAGEEREAVASLEECKE